MTTKQPRQLTQLESRMTATVDNGIRSSTLRHPIADDMAHSPHGATTVPKRERYKWSRPSEPGELKWIPKRLLAVDHIYQREKVSEEKVLTIAREFGWMLYLVLGVARRPDGTMVVYEGGNRLLAAMKRDDIDLVPCIIFDVDEIADEARAFVGTNLLRSTVSAVERHKGALVAGEPSAIAASELVSRFGYTVVRSGNAPFTIKCIRVVEKKLAADPQTFERVFALATDIANGEQIHVAVLRGLHAVARVEPLVFSAQNVEKLVNAGQAVLVNEMAREKALSHHGGDRVEAVALVNFLNKGRRTNRLSLRKGRDEGSVE